MMLVAAASSRASQFSHRIIAPIPRISLGSVRCLQQSADEDAISKHIVLEHHAHRENADAFITTLTMNRPKANAWNKNMLEQLKNSLEKLQDSDSRCLVLTSALAPKVFSAGADLKERATMSIDEAEAFVADLRDTFQQVAELPMPVIASVQGAALGGGLELALAADIRVASSKSKLGLVETSLAILPGAGGTQRLFQLVGMGRAKDLIFSARTFTGSEAYQYGLVQHLVDDSDDEASAASPETNRVLAASLDLAWKIAANGPIAVRSAKQALDNSSRMREALQIERECYAKCLPTTDRLEGLNAFRDGRPPKYQGK